MKKLALFVSLVMCVARPVQAQVLVQDAKSASSILYRGNAINIDPTQSLISFAVNSFGNEYRKEKKAAVFWGIQASAKSKSGLAGIIDAGSFAPEGSFNLSGGLSWTREENPGYVNAKQELDKLYSTRGQQVADIHPQIKALINSTKSSPGISTDAAITKKIDDVYVDNGTDELADAYQKLANAETDATKKAELTNLGKALRELIVPFQMTRALTEKGVARYRDQLARSYWKERHLVYGLLGGTGSSFMHVKGPLTTNDLNDRFEKKKFDSFRYGMGYNYQRAGKTVIGISLVGQRADNFSSLESSEYTLTTTTQINSSTATTQPVAATTVTQKLDDKQVIIGYSGNYQTYHQTGINVDLVKFYKGSDNEKSVLALNYYGRYTISSKPTVVPSILTVGAGAYFFQNNGTFLGGVYVEFPDLTNEAEALKPSPSFKPFYTRVSFGIVTKFSISSIISYAL